MRKILELFKLEPLDVEYEEKLRKNYHYTIDYCYKYKFDSISFSKQHLDLVFIREEELDKLQNANYFKGFGKKFQTFEIILNKELLENLTKVKEDLIFWDIDKDVFYVKYLKNNKKVSFNLNDYPTLITRNKVDFYIYKKVRRIIKQEIEIKNIEKDGFFNSFNLLRNIIFCNDFNEDFIDKFDENSLLLLTD